MSPIRGGRKYAISRASAYQMTGVTVLYICACVYRVDIAAHLTGTLIAYYAAMAGTNIGHNTANMAEAIKAGAKSTVRVEQTTVTEGTK